MRKADKRSLLLVLGISLVLSMAGCVDTSVNPIPSSISYQSQVNFVNLVSGGGAVTLKMIDHSGATSYDGTLDVGNESGFETVQAGNKTLNASFASGPSQVYKFALATDYKFRIFIAGTDSSNDAYRVAERYIWQTKDSPNGAALFPADTGWIAFFNGSPDATINQVQISGETTTTITLGVGLGDGSSYAKLKAGSYDFTASYTYTYAPTDTTTADTTVTMMFSQDLASKGRYTAVFYNPGANLQYKVLTDD
jgi:hypothetical protein